MADDAVESVNPNTEETPQDSSSTDVIQQLDGGENEVTVKTFKELVSPSHRDEVTPFHRLNKRRSILC